MAEDPTQFEKETTINVPAGQEPDSPNITVASKVCGPAPYVSVFLEKYCAGQVVETDGRKTTAQTRPYDYYAAGYFNQATAGAIDLQPVADRVAERLDLNNPISPLDSEIVGLGDEPEVTATALNDAASGLRDAIGEELSKIQLTVRTGVDETTKKRDLNFCVEREGKKLIDVSGNDIDSFDLGSLGDAFEGNSLEGEGSEEPGAELIQENGGTPTNFKARFEAMSSGEAGEQANDTNNINAIVTGGFVNISVLQANLATALQANFGFNLANNNGNSGNP